MAKAQIVTGANGGGETLTYGLTTISYTGRTTKTIPITNGLIVAWDGTTNVHAIYSFEDGAMTKQLEYASAQASGSYANGVLTFSEYYSVTLLVYQVE